MILSYRMSLLRAAVAGPDIQAFAGAFRLPTRLAARPWIRHIVSNGDYLTVHVKDVERPLQWPSNYPLRDLYKVVTECCTRTDWHYYEVPETRVEPGMTVVDCGAAEGIFSLLAETRAEKVYAFEPNADYVRVLARTFHDSRVFEAVPMALSDHSSAGSLAGQRYWSTVVEGDGDILITSIDDWACGRQVDYIKADVEGMEHAVLRGATDTISRWRPRIAITTYHKGNDAGQMIELLRGLVPSYRMRTKGTSFNGGVRRPVMLHAWV